MCIAAVLLSRMVPVAVVTSPTLYCSAFLALCGHNCSDWQSHLACVAGIKGGREEGKKVEKRESPPPFKSQLANSNILLLANNVQGEMACVFLFLFFQFLCGNCIVERVCHLRFSFSLSLVHSPNIHPRRDFFRSKLPLVCYVQSRFYNLKFASKI